jgi:hypothetical protein
VENKQQTNEQSKKERNKLTIKRTNKDKQTNILAFIDTEQADKEIHC